MSRLRAFQDPTLWLILATRSVCLGHAGGMSLISSSFPPPRPFRGSIALLAVFGLSRAFNLLKSVNAV